MFTFGNHCLATIVSLLSNYGIAMLELICYYGNINWLIGHMSLMELLHTIFANQINITDFFVKEPWQTRVW